MRPFERLLVEQDTALQKLSRLLHGRYTVDELRSESWIVLCEVDALRQEPLELGNPREQLLLVECLKRHIARARRGSFSTLSLDYGGDSRSERPALLWFLAAPEDSDPLVELEEFGEQIGRAISRRCSTASTSSPPTSSPYPHDHDFLLSISAPPQNR